MIEITIPGKPIEKKRARFTRWSKKPYNPQKKEEEAWKWQAKQQIDARVQDIYTGPVTLAVDFFMPPTKDWSKRKRESLAIRNIWHVKKPDLDNLIKFVKDCLNGLAWKDDSQVCVLQARKLYAIEPKTVICVRSR